MYENAYVVPAVLGVTALVSVGSVSISGEGSLNLMAMPAVIRLRALCALPLKFTVAKGYSICYNQDVTAQKYSLKGCRAVAQELSNRLQNRFQVDSILCMDGTSAVGACLARKLTQHGGRSLSEGDDMYIIKGELDGKGNLIFRDNARFMLEGKRVLILMCSLTTGTTALQGRQSVEYYGGKVVGVASIYAAFHELEGLPVISIFDTSVIKDYASHSPSECPMCKAGQPIDAVVNTFGFSKI